MPNFAGAKGSYVGQGNAKKPIKPGTVPDDALVELTTRVMKRFSKSRELILQCRAIRRGEKRIELDPRWLAQNAAAAEWVQQVLPERTMIPLNLVNLLASEKPQISRHPRSSASDRAVHQADEFESWINALMRQMYDWDESIGKKTEDGENGIIVMPSLAAIEHVPDYMTSIGKDGTRKPNPRYDRDEKGKKPGDTNYGTRSERASVAAYRDDVKEYFASNPPFVVRIVPATDCAPILVRGRGKRRWECRGLVTRQLFEVEELISRKFRWEGMGDRELIPRGYTEYGCDGQVWLYEAFLTHVDQDSGQETPFIARCVGGKETWTVDPSGEKQSATIDLKEEYGLHKLMVGYSWGLHHADDDPEFRGIPILAPLIQTILRVEGLSTAAAVMANENAFTGYVATPDKDIPPEAYLNDQGAFETFEKPGPTEIKLSPGPIQPWAQAQMGRDAWQLIAQERQILQMNVPDESQTGGKTDASGHSMVVSHELLESAKRQIKEGGRDEFEFVAECLTELACGLARGDWDVLGGMKVNLPVYEDFERTVEATGERTTITGMVEFQESWVGNNYAVTADYPNVGNLAERQQVIEAWEKKAATFEEMRRIAWGDMSPETTRRQIARDRFIESDVGQAMFTVEVLKERKMRAERMVAEAQLAGIITKLGIPIDAIEPGLMDEFAGAMQQTGMGGPPGMPGMAPGGAPVGPGGYTSLPNMAASSLGGAVSGEMGTSARTADANAALVVNPSGV